LQSYLFILEGFIPVVLYKLRVNCRAVLRVRECVNGVLSTECSQVYSDDFQIQVAAAQYATDFVCVENVDGTLLIKNTIFVDIFLLSPRLWTILAKYCNSNSNTCRKKYRNTNNAILFPSQYCNTVLLQYFLQYSTIRSPNIQGAAKKWTPNVVRRFLSNGLGFWCEILQLYLVKPFTYKCRVKCDFV